MGLRYKDQFIDQGKVKKQKKKRKKKIVQPEVEIECDSIQVSEEPGVEYSTPELLKLRQQILIKRIPLFQPKAEDTKPIAEAIQSGNHMKIYAGFVAFKKLLETKMKE